MTVALLACITSGLSYFIVFTAFPLGGKITGALAAASAPETDYSSASYAALVWEWSNGIKGLSVVEIAFGTPWIADLAASINTIAGFA